MNIAQIENNLQELMESFSKETFIFDLLLAYGSPKASITRLRKGNLNLSDKEGVLSWKRKVLFKEVFDEDLHLAVTELATQVKHAQRFVIVTDYQLLLAIDVKTQDKLDIDLKDLPQHYDFFLPWAGMEKAQHADENPADVKAAERMAKLFDEIKKDNPDNSPEFVHGLNVFLSRLLFCFFAEDTDIFDKGQFTHAISSHTQKDGSDLSSYLNTLFDVLNTPKGKRTTIDGGAVPVYLDSFPYVNGGLFREKIDAPVFTRRSRQAVLDSGELNWSAINPDIFGSMIQAVITPEHRGGLGMHYTSVPNIMKVIEPLFLDDLYEEFESSKYEPKKLNQLLNRIGKIKIFDPACGSGNFLIIAYKELRRFEIQIIKQLQSLQSIVTGFEPKQLELIPKSQLNLAAQFQVELFSRIQLSQFYGIELDDFAHEIAQLSLWLAEHQMNVEFFKEFGRTNPTLPLKEAGNIVRGNACRIDWEEVCPKDKGSEVYILGNPPYLGSSLQNTEQKNDMTLVFKAFKNYKKLDYIAAWFIKGANYIQNHNAQFAFVSTNSICQGEQVALLWPPIFEKNLEIGFAHTSFKWNNNAKANAGVTVIIVGVRNNSKLEKNLFSESRKYTVNNINAYLANAQNIIVEKRSKLLSDFPEMVKGSSPTDGGNLILSLSEKDSLVNSGLPLNTTKKYVGAFEFINENERYCLWLSDEEASKYIHIEEINKRLNNVSIMRNASPKKATRDYATKPHRFIEIRHQETPTSIIIPRVSSSRRSYLPCSFLDNNSIISDSALAIYSTETFIFSILSSLLHLTWVRAVAGYLKTDYRYSNLLCYNTFPFPLITETQKEELTQCVFFILEEREKHSEKTLAQLYDPDKMPEGLREAHRQNDLAIERCYRSRPFESDEERLEYLFKLYEKMIAEEEEKNTLFAKEKKSKKGRSNEVNASY